MLTVTDRRKIQARDLLQGLCYSDGLLYAGERRRESGRYSLAVYRVQRDSGDITLLDRLELETGAKPLFVCPRIERHSGRVFVPCRGIGVTVARLEGDRLVRERTLTRVKGAVSVDAVSPDTVYICDYDSERVHVLDVREDEIKSTLQKPDTVRGAPWRLAVLGDSVMVSYTRGSIVIYHHGSPIYSRVIRWSDKIGDVTAVCTDCHLHFIVTDGKNKCVRPLEYNGEFCTPVGIPTDRGPQDCAVVNGQLWVGCANGDIVIMS